MTAYKRGDVVLVGFVFADESGLKRRPAVIVSSPAYHRNRQELVVAAVTSNVSRLHFGDYAVAGWREAGLLFPSVVTGILCTIKEEMIHRRLGSLPARDMAAIDRNLRDILGLAEQGRQRQ